MKKSAYGFTLVELLVVISIIAILSVIGITIFSSVQKNARDARRRGDIEAISKAWEVNFGKTTQGQYDKLDPTWFANTAIPLDPTTKGNYIYVGAANTTTAGTNYKVCTDLETVGTSVLGAGTEQDYCKSNQQ